MSAEQLTLMAVHAHPDDEGFGTGGVLARYAAEGVRTVLVTMTDGAMGDSPGGLKPESAEHDLAATIEIRHRELRESCRILGVRHLELMGYRDSGMMGWPQNADPQCTWQQPVEAIAARLEELFRRYRPQVVITYDANGLYGHPDHIQAHRATMLATQGSGIPDKVYFTCVPMSYMKAWEEHGRSIGQPLSWDGDEPPFGTPDQEITTSIDCSPYVDAKIASIRAHDSQAANFSIFNLGEEFYRASAARESFVRAFDRTGAPLPEDDLFSGIRS